MVLQSTTDDGDFVVMIFRKDKVEKSMVRYVAETILELGDDPAGVPTEALHYCIPGHPFSSMQRLRELCAAYRRQWNGMELYVKESHTFKKNRYYFTGLFMAWLRTNISDIERVVYPVTSRREFRDDK